MNHCIKAVFLVLFASQAFSNKNAGHFIGEDCRGPDEQEGVCKLPMDCSYILQANITVKRKFLHPSIKCEFDGTKTDDFVVCCPKEPHKNKAVDACKNFGKKPDTLEFLSIKIFEGEEADPAEFPYFAALRSNSEGKLKFICGGVLISENFVLTAAHCAVGSRGLFSVRLGKTSLDESRNDEFLGIDVDIEVDMEIFLHPNYSAQTKYNDIALLKLNRSVKFEENIWPACLHVDQSQSVSSFQIAGFGFTDNRNNGGKPSDWLLKAGVEEIPAEECHGNYTQSFKNVAPRGLPNWVEETQLCAKNRTSRSNTCQGDSGSGLVHNSGENYHVYGITSFGLSCTSPVPSIYTRVSKYIEWIERKVWA